MKRIVDLYEVEVDYHFKYKITNNNKYATLSIRTWHTMYYDFEGNLQFAKPDSNLLYDEKCTLYYNGFDLYREKRDERFIPVECEFSSYNRYPDYFTAKKLNVTQVEDIPLPEGWIMLSNGKVLKSRYGKYEPNLLLISDVPVDFKEEFYGSTLNLDIPGTLKVLYGKFFTTKNGKNAFEVISKEKAPHMLLQDDWGGAWSKYCGGVLELSDALYYRRASSNGGGTGYDYAVLPKRWKNNPSIEDY